MPAALLTPCAAEPVGHAANDVRKGLASQVDHAIEDVRRGGIDANLFINGTRSLQVNGPWTDQQIAPAQQALWTGPAQATAGRPAGTSAPRTMKARGARDDDSVVS